MSPPIDRLTCWLDSVRVIAISVSVTAIRDTTLPARALLADTDCSVRADSSFVTKDPVTGRVYRFVLETLAIPGAFRAGVGELEVIEFFAVCP